MSLVFPYTISNERLPIKDKPHMRGNKMATWEAPKLPSSYGHSKCTATQSNSERKPETS